MERGWFFLLPAEPVFSCSSCGREFPDAAHGFSACDEHEEWERWHDAPMGEEERLAGGAR